jgi:hypothetical protein
MPTRPRPLACHLLCGLLACGVSQADVGGVIRQCSALTDKDARIACLEDALRRTDDSGDSAAAVAETSTAAREAKSAPREAPAEPAATVPPPAPESAVSPGHDGTADTLGAEQVRDYDRRDADDRVMATVVAFDYVRYQRLRVQFDNGQVWRQVDGDRVDVSRELDADATFDVEVWKTGLGGYRMRIVELDRTLRVQRLR